MNFTGLHSPEDDPVSKALSDLSVWEKAVAAINLGSGTPWSALADPFKYSAPSEDEKRLRDEIQALRSDIDEKAKRLQQSVNDSAARETAFREMSDQLTELRTKLELGYILQRISEEARQSVLASKDLKRQFTPPSTCQAFIMSIDLRRSTELMLRARSPEASSEFISGLCNHLQKIIVRNHGVFDKFTGDGILAFFPDFFSGTDSGYYALNAADECHQLFSSFYKRHRHCFSVVMSEIGLGIGLDYGEVHLLRLADGLTVVGTPVVYACRLGSAPPSSTLLNQPAFEVISSKYSQYCSLAETKIDIKHEGPLTSYSASIARAGFIPAKPGWAHDAK